MNLTEHQEKSPLANWRWMAIGLLIVGGIAARFLPHPPNFGPMGAVALFAGAAIADRRLAMFIPLAILGLSDAVIGFHSLIPAVYGCFLINVLIGRWVGKDRNPLMIFSGALVGAIQFFVLTNLANWWAYYPHTLDGLMENYISAIPFFQNSLMGDLVFTTILFGSWNLAERFAADWRDQRQTMEI